MAPVSRYAMGSAGIHQGAIDHLSQNQHVVAGRVFVHDTAFEPSRGLTQQGRPGTARRPFDDQLFGAGWPTEVGG